ncbi:PREDICTED: uncharacterized protein LOC106746671 [Dinoponera quadriceps]|uniref:Uncharacterized protein LOC106746671 n=1 Tax=Dinoponera quadriceps TaxID=609295 RepID=A0A6P3XLV0_DINQU|nr:PREDICTED: uncharacterized protein LOC106746671 [Dinoponera quadriceps]
MSDYFLDQKKYFYFILLHTNATLCVGTLVTIATGTMLAGYLKHVCGMFRIASYRMEQAININIVEDVSPVEEIMICKKIIYAVDIHRKAMRFTKLVLSTFEGMFLFLLVFGISQIVTFGDDIEEFILRIAFVVTILLYIFLMNYVAQEIMDSNEHIFVTAYNIRWYVAPLHIQKMILFLLQKGTKAFTLNFGGLFVASLESASTLASASISYFTILYSTRQ